MGIPARTSREIYQIVLGASWDVFLGANSVPGLLSREGSDFFFLTGLAAGVCHAPPTWVTSKASNVAPRVYGSRSLRGPPSSKSLCCSALDGTRCAETLQSWKGVPSDGGSGQLQRVASRERREYVRLRAPRHGITVHVSASASPLARSFLVYPRVVL